MLKSCGVGGVVAHVILVSAQGPNPSFFSFGGLLLNLGACLDKCLDSDLDQGLTIFKCLQQGSQASAQSQHMVSTIRSRHCNSNLVRFSYQIFVILS